MVLWLANDPLHQLSTWFMDDPYWFVVYPHHCPQGDVSILAANLNIDPMVYMLLVNHEGFFFAGWNDKQTQDNKTIIQNYKDHY